MKYTKENRRKIDEWLSDPYFKSLVENDVGIPVKVKVLWEQGVIDFYGPKMAKQLQIKNILDAYGKQNLN